MFAGALINVDATLGAHTSINLACTISHDCHLGDYVSLDPGYPWPEPSRSVRPWTSALGSAFAPASLWAPMQSLAPELQWCTIYRPTAY